MLKITDILERNYADVNDLLKFGETKNTTLIAFNGAIIVGLVALLKDVSLPILKIYMAYVIGMCAISIFISFSSLAAKLKHKANDVALTRSNNVLFFGTMACLTESELVDKIKQLYSLDSINEAYERDLAKQLVIVSQIVVRKFKFFNFALRFMFFGLLTPVSIFVYYIWFNNDK